MLHGRHTGMVRDWLAQPDKRVQQRSIPACLSHINPIERLWGAMHKALMHHRWCENLTRFRTKMLKFLRDTVPVQWHRLRDQVSDNLRVIDPNSCRILS